MVFELTSTLAAAGPDGFGNPNPNPALQRRLKQEPSSPKALAVENTTTMAYQEVVLLFRPVCSLAKVDQGFISGC